MKDPSPYDDSGWIDQNVSKNSSKDFRKLFSKIHRSLDEEFLLNSLRNKFQSQGQPKHRLFRAVVDGFSPKSGANGSDSGFETTIVNPLFEEGQTDAEVLLAKSQANGQIHLCFVSCRVGTEAPQAIAQEINQISSIVSTSGNQDNLKIHLQSSHKDIRSIQYITLTRDKDLIDLDYEVVKISTNPDEYAIWSLVEGELPEEKDQSIQHKEGSVHHAKLREIGQRGIDVTLADNDDIRYCLTSHPVIPIGEVCMRVYLQHISDNKPNPKELQESEFETHYQNKIELGVHRTDIIEKKAKELVSTAVELDVLSEDAEDPNDYKIMWGSEKAGDIKEMVKYKYFKNELPDERGNIAFEKAKSQWEDPNQSFSDFDFDT